MTASELALLLEEFLKLPCETEWVEFKLNNDEPDEIGEYISAQSNSAALEGKEFGWIVWGVTDPPKQRFEGTTVSLKSKKVGGEELEHWLTKLLQPQVDFRIFEFVHDGKRAVVVRVPAASHMPVGFKHQEWIRVGTYKKKLKDCGAKARSLWGLFVDSPFEKGIAKSSLDIDDVISHIDYQSFFDLLKKNLPDTKVGILSELAKERVIKKQTSGKYDITNFGALLFAKSIGRFSDIARKAIRVITYPDTHRDDNARERPGQRGYACGFENAIEYIKSQLPPNEHIELALRKDTRVYPDLAIRELVANALIHQDLDARGTSPLVEIFSDRIEISNPGKPLIDVKRFVDEPPQSRNETLAGFLRRVGVGEERGSGIDKVISRVELFQLPPPDFRVTENHTIAILYGPKPLNALTQDEKVRGCYQHACLLCVSNKQMTNATLRKRFKIADVNYSTASRIISDTMDAGLIRQYDPSNTSKKHAKYVPFWA